MSLALQSNNTINTITGYWDFLFVTLADPRTNDWPLIKSPLPGLTLLGCYLYFVLSWGPRYMENRKPFKIQPILVVYNFLQVLLSVYLVYEGLDGAWLRDYSFVCEPTDRRVNPFNMRVCRGFYTYFIAKLTELLDTVFFVLRKKNSQITFLHLYHHTCMPMISWGVVKYYPGGHAAFEGTLNSFVHVIMYSYYLISSMGPKYQHLLWWKKYITVLQMFQFAISFYHSAQLLWVPCDFPWWATFFALPNALFFFYLFADFYKKEYLDNKNKKLKLEDKQQ